MGQDDRTSARNERLKTAIREDPFIFKDCTIQTQSELIFFSITLIPRQQRLSEISQPIRWLTCIFVCSISLVVMREHTLCVVLPKSRICSHIYVDPFSFLYQATLDIITNIPKAWHGQSHRCAFSMEPFLPILSSSLSYTYIVILTQSPLPTDFYLYVFRMSIRLLPKQRTKLSFRLLCPSYPVLYLCWNGACGLCIMCPRATCMDEWWVLMERTVLIENRKSAPNVIMLDPFLLSSLGTNLRPLPSVP